MKVKRSKQEKKEKKEKGEIKRQEKKSTLVLI